jgi:hypothetical protein
LNLFACTIRNATENGSAAMMRENTSDFVAQFEADQGSKL